MRRPLIWFSGFFAIGTALELILGLHAVLWIALAVLCTAGLVLSRLVSQKAVVMLCVISLLAGSGYTAFRDVLFVQPQLALEGTTYEVTAVATDYAVVYGDRQRVPVKISGDECDQRFAVKTLLTLPTRSQKIRPGDTITAHVDFYTPTASGTFDRPAYYRSLGYCVLAYAKETYPIFLKQTDQIPLLSYPKVLRHAVSERLDDLFSERNAAFLSAMLVGDRSKLTQLDNNHLRKAGLAHVIAVSGLHVGFLIALLLFVFGRRLGSLLGIPCLLLFVLVVGCSPSVLRACIMYGMVLLAFLMRREADSVNSLFLALFICLLWHPAALCSVSLQLSFTSTLGILCFAWRIQQSLTPKSKKLPHRLKRLTAVFTASISCSLASLLLTWPVQLFQFRYLSVFAPIANLLALWAVTLIFPMAIFAIAVSLISGSAAAVIAAPVSAFCSYVWWIADRFAGISGGVLHLARGTDVLVLGGLMVFWTVLLWFGNRRQIAVSVPVLVLCLIGYGKWDAVRTQETWRMTCLSVGESQAIVVSQGDQTALIDCGSDDEWNAADAVCEYLDWWGYDRIDVMVLTALDSSHAGGAVTLADRLPVDMVYLPNDQRKSAEQIQERFAQNACIVDDTEQLTAIGDTKLRLSAVSVDTCLAVRLTPAAENIWIIHSMTPRQLEYLESKQTLHPTTLVLSESYFSDDAGTIAEQIAPEQIILESGWKTAEELGGIPVISLKQTGSYTHTYLHP